MALPSSHLTDGQLALLRAELEQRRRHLDGRVAQHHGGQSRAEHAREVLEQTGHDAPQRESEREMDMALSDLEVRELGEVSQALRRLDDERFGACIDCGDDIPFDRLRVEPWAARCIACESRHEAAARRLG